MVGSPRACVVPWIHELLRCGKFVLPGIAKPSKKRPCADWRCCAAWRSTTCITRTAAGRAGSPPPPNCPTYKRRGPYAGGRDKLLASGWGNLPPCCDGGPAALFAAVDRYECANPRLYQDIEGALPVELDMEQYADLHATAEGVTASGLPYVPPSPGRPNRGRFAGRRGGHRLAGSTPIELRARRELRELTGAARRRD